MALLAEYSFDTNGAGTVADLTGNGHTGTLVANGTWFSPGHNSNGCIYNPGARADGSGMTVPRTGLEPTTAVTVMCWLLQADTGQLYRAALTKSRTGSSDSYAIYSGFGAGKANVPAATITTTSGSFNAEGPTAVLADQAWHHLAASYDGANLKLYVDGTLVTTTPATGTLVYDTATAFTVLTSAAFPGQSALAEIDDVRVYNTALTGPEIVTLRDTPAGTTPPGGTTHQGGGTVAATSSTSGGARIVGEVPTARDIEGTFLLEPDRASFVLEADMARTFYRTMPEYATGTFTEKNGQDVSSATILVGLSPTGTPFVPPTTWITPDAITRPTTSTIKVSLLIDSDMTAGDFHLWAKVVDSSETLPRAATNEPIKII